MARVLTAFGINEGVPDQVVEHLRARGLIVPCDESDFSGACIPDDLKATIDALIATLKTGTEGA